MMVMSRGGAQALQATIVRDDEPITDYNIMEDTAVDEFLANNGWQGSMLVYRDHRIMFSTKLYHFCGFPLHLAKLDLSIPILRTMELSFASTRIAV